jgi:protein tyrosine phosphatase
MMEMSLFNLNTAISRKIKMMMQEIFKDRKQAKLVKKKSKDQRCSKQQKYQERKISTFGRIAKKKISKYNNILPYDESQIKPLSPRMKPFPLSFKFGLFRSIIFV